MSVSFEDFQELEIKIGTVKTVADHPDADNLLLLEADVGAEEPRQLVAGIKDDYEPDGLVGRQIVVLTNLEPAVIRGEKARECFWRQMVRMKSACFNRMFLFPRGRL